MLTWTACFRWRCLFRAGSRESALQQGVRAIFCVAARKAGRGRKARDRLAQEKQHRTAPCRPCSLTGQAGKPARPTWTQQVAPRVMCTPRLWHERNFARTAAPGKLAGPRIDLEVHSEVSIDSLPDPPVGHPTRRCLAHSLLLIHVPVPLP